jgi:uncharacterized membrane protein
VITERSSLRQRSELPVAQAHCNRGCSDSEPEQTRSSGAFIMEYIDTSITVRVPVHTAYNQWTQFEEFPRFMDGVKEIHQLDDTHLHWVAEIGGKRKEWDVEITEQLPDQRIAWRSVEGIDNSGVVEFRPLDSGETEVLVHIGYEPEGALEQIGGALQVPNRRVQADLERFKRFVESRGAETGAWRGEVHGGSSDERSAGSLRE